MQQLEAIAEKSGYLYAFPSLVFSADTRNTEAMQFLDKVKEALTKIDNQLLFFDLELQDLDTSKFSELQASPLLSTYHHYLDRIGQKQRLIIYKKSLLCVSPSNFKQMN